MFVKRFWKIFHTFYRGGPALTMSNIAYILLVYMNGDLVTNTFSRREVPGAWDLATGEKCTQ